MSGKAIDRREHDVLRQLIKRWRVEADLSQREVSARLGKPHNYIVKIESGVRGLEVVDLVDIIRVLGKDIAVSFSEYGALLEATETDHSPLLQESKPAS